MSQQQSEQMSVQAQMMQIVHSMKEIPMLPSEIPPKNDINALLKVEFPEAGGILTYMEKYDYPYKGFPFFEFVDKVDLVKKICRQVQSGVYHALKRKSKIELLKFIPMVPVLGDTLFRAFTFSFYRLIERSRIKSERYCGVVREIYRVWSIDPENEDPETKDLRLMLRDIECMILEFDNAYRYRGQDILAEMNQEMMKENPVKEMNRLLDVMIDREVLEEKKDTWRLLQMFVSYYMQYDERLLSIFQNILVGLDLDKIRLDIGDKEFCVRRKDYIFGFMMPGECEKPENALVIAKSKLLEEYDNDRELLLNESTKKHDELKSSQYDEQVAIAYNLTDEEKIKVSEEIKIKNQELSDAFVKAQQILNDEFKVKQDTLMASFLNDDQRALEVKQLPVRVALDDEYNVKLKDLDNKFVQNKQELIHKFV